MFFKKVRSLVFYPVIGSLFFPVLLWAGQPWTILTYDSPPFSFQSGKAKQIRGLSIDIGKRMLENAGYTIAEIKQMPWKTALKEIERTPRAILHNVARLPLREKQYQWIGPYYTVRIMLYKSVARDDIAFSHLKEARWFKVAAERGSGFINHDMRPKGITVLEANTNYHVLKMLKAGAIDLAALPEHTIRQLCTELGVPAGDFEPVVTVVSRDVYFTVEPNTPQHVVLGLRASLGALKKRGELHAIMARY